MVKKCLNFWPYYFRILYLFAIILIGVSMCLICVEYYYQRMTRDEVNKALFEMVLFAKTDEERNHFKKLQNMDSAEDLEKEAKLYVFENSVKDKDKNEYKTSFKTRRP